MNELRTSNSKLDVQKTCIICLRNKMASNKPQKKIPQKIKIENP